MCLVVSIGGEVRHWCFLLHFSLSASRLLWCSLTTVLLPQFCRPSWCGMLYAHGLINLCKTSRRWVWDSPWWDCWIQSSESALRGAEIAKHRERMKLVVLKRFEKCKNLQKLLHRKRIFPCLSPISFMSWNHHWKIIPLRMLTNKKTQVKSCFLFSNLKLLGSIEIHFRPYFWSGYNIVHNFKKPCHIITY